MRIMAQQQPNVNDRTYEAEGNLSASQFCAVKHGSTPRHVVVCTSTDRPIGILQNDPTLGQSAVVRQDGTSKVKADGAFTAGDILGVNDANGEIDTAAAMTGGAATAWQNGTALETSTGAGDIVEAEINIQRYSAT